MQDLYICTDPTQETRPISCRSYSSHPANISQIIPNHTRLYQVYYCTTVLLYCTTDCTTVLLYCTTVLSYCTTVLLSYCLTVLLYYCTTVQHEVGVDGLSDFVHQFQLRCPPEKTIFSPTLNPSKFVDKEVHRTPLQLYHSLKKLRHELVYRSISNKK